MFDLSLVLPALEDQPAVAEPVDVEQRIQIEQTHVPVVDAAIRAVAIAQVYPIILHGETVQLKHWVVCMEAVFAGVEAQVTCDQQATERSTIAAGFDRKRAQCPFVVPREERDAAARFCPPV